MGHILFSSCQVAPAIIMFLYADIILQLGAMGLLKTINLCFNIEAEVVANNKFIQ